jgi:hypothetical protein
LKTNYQVLSRHGTNHLPSYRTFCDKSQLTQDSTTPRTANSPVVGDPGHVLGYDCVALRAGVVEVEAESMAGAGESRIFGGREQVFSAQVSVQKKDANLEHQPQKGATGRVNG